MMASKIVYAALCSAIYSLEEQIRRLEGSVECAPDSLLDVLRRVRDGEKFSAAMRRDIIKNGEFSLHYSRRSTQTQETGR